MQRRRGARCDDIPDLARLADGLVASGRLGDAHALVRKKGGHGELESQACAMCEEGREDGRARCR